MIAFSTAYKEALIAIEIEGRCAFKSLDSNCKHSENMLFSVDQMLDEIEKSIKDNDYYSVVIGPGSFTGLRIGISLIKGLLAGDETQKVIPLTTFDLMAYSYIKNYHPKDNFVCIINGLSGYYFICEYSYNGKKQSNDQMITKEELLSLSTTTVGLSEESCGQIKVTPSAKELLEISKEKLSNGKVIEAGKLVPMYLRKSQAEAGLDEKKNIK